MATRGALVAAFAVLLAVTGVSRGPAAGTEPAVREGAAAAAQPNIVVVLIDDIQPTCCST